MSDEAPLDDTPASEPSSLRGMFPWHFGAPTPAQFERFLLQGMVVFDTNALFDAYRLNPQGREEFLRTLALLGDRLWVPHRVADEFGRRRLDVIAECAGAVGDLAKSLAAHFRKIKSEIEHFGSRRGLEKSQVDELIKFLSENEEQVAGKIKDSYRFDLKAADCGNDDPILAEIERLLAGRIGPPLKDMRQVREDAAYRYERRIPPGYGDKDKPPEQAIGDYVLWVQLLHEAAIRRVPVLLVTNESKTAEDWVIKPPGSRSPLPRPELSAEIWEQVRQPFHLVSVRRFLTLANKFLGAKVSEETIAQVHEITRAIPASIMEQLAEEDIADKNLKAATDNLARAHQCRDEIEARMLLLDPAGHEFDDAYRELLRAEEYVTWCLDDLTLAVNFSSHMQQRRQDREGLRPQ